MSRTVPLLLALALLALPAAAQLPMGAGASVTLSGLPSDAVRTNQTQEVIPFDVDVDLGAGTCLGGGVVTVALKAAAGGPDNATATTVRVEPESLEFRIGELTTATGAYRAQGRAALLVQAGVVTEETPVNATVQADLSSTCNGATAPDGASDRGNATVTFQPVSALQFPNGEEVVPGPALPVLAVAIVALALMLRRRA